MSKKSISDKSDLKNPAKKEMAKKEMAKKEMGFVTILSLVLGVVIGGGILVLPSALAQYGKWGFWAWPIASVAGLSLAFIFGHLSKTDKDASGPASYVKKLFGDFTGFQIAWSHWFGLSMGTGIIAVSFASYTVEALHLNPAMAMWIALGSTWGMLLLMSFFTLVSLGTLIVLSFIKVGALMLISSIGLPSIKANLLSAVPISTVSGGVAGVFGAVALAFFAFVGIESATLPGASVKNPTRNIPLATISGTIIAAVLFTLTYAVVYSVVPLERLLNTNTPVSDAAQILIGPFGEILIAYLAVIACFGSLNGCLFATAHIARSSAENGWLPRFFSRMTPACFPVGGGIITALVVTAFILLFYLSPEAIRYDIRNYAATLEVFLISIVYLTSTMAYKLSNGKTWIWTVGTVACIGCLFGSINTYTAAIINIMCFFAGTIIYTLSSGNKLKTISQK